MTLKTIALIGAPVDMGAGMRGCGMGPAALRVAGLAEALTGLGHPVRDLGDLAAAPLAAFRLNGQARAAAEIAGWTRRLESAAYEALAEDCLPVFMGGDHALSMGTVSGAARHAASQNRPLFVLWLDAHADFNTPATSPSGNMHGMPVAFFTGDKGFDGILPANRPLVQPQNVHILGVRSIDRAERRALADAGINVHDMRALDEHGVIAPVRALCEQVRRENGLLHVSLDADFLDPQLAPGVGTPVSGGATYREAHLIMEMLADYGLVSSLDLVELNPFLDERGKSALMLTELAASLFGRRIFETPVVSTARAAAHGQMPAPMLLSA